MCYYDSRSQFRPGSGRFLPENIDPSLCTHMIYAFAMLIDDHLAIAESNDDGTAETIGQ